MPQEVMLYHSGMQGAPSSTLVALGGLIAVLDACLVNGFNVNAISTLTRSGAVATATTSGTNGYAVGDWVDVSGAAQAEYNGRVRVTGKPAVNQFTYAVTGAPATPATGTITSKIGAAGWTKPFAGTNTAVYTTGAGSLGHSMQVEDDNPYADANAGARTRIVLGASGVPDSGTGLGEQDRIQKLNGGWVLVADHKTCYLAMNGANVFMFGEFASLLTGDLYSFFQNRGLTQVGNTIAGTSNQGVLSWAGLYYPSQGIAVGATNNNMGATIIRGVSQLAGHVFAYPLFSANQVAYGSGGSTDSSVRREQTIGMPNAADSAVPMVPEFICEVVGAVHTLRGRLRGMYWPFGGLSTGFSNNFQILDDVVIGGAVVKIAVLRIGTGSSNQIAIDLGTSWG